MSQTPESKLKTNIRRAARRLGARYQGNLGGIPGVKGRFDATVWWFGAVALEMEVKEPGKKLSDDQMDMMDDLTQRLVPCVAVDSRDKAIQAIRIIDKLNQEILRFATPLIKSAQAQLDLISESCLKYRRFGHYKELRKTKEQSCQERNQSLTVNDADSALGTTENDPKTGLFGRSAG